MFVIPPPPGYQGVSTYGNPGIPVTIVPPIEKNNTFSRPTGPEYQFLAGEGLYVLRYDLHLATPQAHPTEGLPTIANPLATTVYPPRAGTRVSLVAVTPRKAPVRYQKDGSISTITTATTATTATTTTTNGQAVQRLPSKDQLQKSRESAESDDRAERDSNKSSSQPSTETAATTNGFSGSDGVPVAPAFGEGNASLVAAAAVSSKDPLKRRKPKNNIIKSNTSFISRAIPHDALGKRLWEPRPDVLFAFANIHRAFHWLDLSSQNTGDLLTKLLFTRAHALCHDVNQVTKNISHLDVIMGFSTGDIIWYEPVTQRYARLNKNGIINSSSVSGISWLPGSENLFLAAHSDGTLIVYDKEKDDAPFVPEEGVPASPQAAAAVRKLDEGLHVAKSVNSSNQKCNPVACWKLSHQSINAFAFSPDSKHLAVVCEDGTLRIIDYLKEKLLDLYSSYYGGFICVCWSPDGKYVLTGGQDDLVSIWSIAECRIVARCEGHSSWVSAVAFDPWRCDEKNYRFGSVGEDCKLLLWDFSASTLHRPKAASIRHRGSVSSSFGAQRPALHRPGSQAAAVANRLRSDSNLATSPKTVVDEATTVRHPVQSRLQTARLLPVMSKKVDTHALSWLDFRADCLMTSCADGHIRVWDRPKENDQR